MNTIVIQERQTKYCQAIESTLNKLGHTTNKELLTELRKTYPKLSPTTIHRATVRLSSRGIIAIAPPSPDGSMRYDTNNTPHDHFECLSCGSLRDINIKDKVIPILASSVDGCCISGQLIIKGKCKYCTKGVKHENNNL
jgi:Fe2+ or Zn2+ uptake regulation protein